VATNQPLRNPLAHPSSSLRASAYSASLPYPYFSSLRPLCSSSVPSVLNPPSRFSIFEFPHYSLTTVLISARITCPLVPASYGRKLPLPQNSTHARKKSFALLPEGGS